MKILELRNLLYYVFENRILMKKFKKDDLIHYKKCIDLELKNRKLV